MLQARLVTNLAELEAVAPAWHELHARQPTATPFSGPGWNLACWRHLSRGALRALVFEGRDGLAGVAPLFQEPGPWRRWRWIGELSLPGNHGYPVSDYADLTVASGLEAAVREAFWAWLDAHRGEWRTLDLGLLPAAGALSGGDSPEAVERSEYGGVWGLTLPPTWNEFRQTLNPKFRQLLGRMTRKLEREHEVAYLCIEDPVAAADRFDDLTALHQARWQGVGEPGIFATEPARRFYREVVVNAAAAGRLQLWFLRVDGELAATQLNFRGPERAYYYTAGFRGEEYRRYGLGRILLAHTLQAAISAGAREYDMLRGDYKYKRRLGVIRTPHLRLRAFSQAAWRGSRRAWEGCLSLAKAASQSLRSVRR